MTTGGSDYTLETAESGKIVMVPEFEVAILIASVSLISMVVAYEEREDMQVVRASLDRIEGDYAVIYSDD